MVDVSRKLRRVGLGVMGWATTLTTLGVDYATDTAIELASTIASAMRTEADKCTQLLAEEKGGSPAAAPGRRNVTCLALPPTGGTAPLIGVSYGIEPEFSQAHQVPPEDHVRVQSVWQKYVDASVSKTVNLPTSARPSDVADIYRKAWDFGCKGVTVFRDISDVSSSCGTDCEKPFILRNSNI
jgi:ribonucleoside-diphosphate reductase alpha chain